MPDVYSEVRLDFSGTQQLAANMQAAAKWTGQLQANLAAAQRNMQALNRSLVLARMPALPGQSSASASANARALGGAAAGGHGFGAMAGTAAAGSALFFKATQLANPAAMTRFQMAIEDTTAVIGHKMLPALNAMTRGVRSIGDFLANHPTLSAGIGYGVTGLALAATVGTAWNVGKSAFGGLRGMAGSGGRMLGYGPAAIEAGAVAANGVAATGKAANIAQREASIASALGAQRATQAAQSRLSAANAAIAATGGMGNAAAEREAMLARAEISHIKAMQGRNNPVVHPARTPGKAKGMSGHLAGKGGMVIGSVLGALEVANALGDWEEETRRGPRDGNGDFDPNRKETPSWVTRRIRNLMGSSGIIPKMTGFDPLDIIRGGPFGNSVDKNASSSGAAARPAEYQDVMGSLMEMRQSIASGSRDPATEASQKSVTILEEIRDALKNAGSEGLRGMAEYEKSKRGTR